MNLLLMALVPLMFTQDSSFTDSTGLIPAGITAARADTLLTAYEQYLADQELPYDDWLNLARRLAQASHWQEAVQVYSGLLADFPGDPDARLGRGLVLAWQGDYAAAEQDLKPVTVAHADYIDAWIALGNVYYWWDRPEPAIAAYTGWVNLTPEQAGGYLARAKVYYAARRFPQARRDLRRAAGLDGDIAQIDGLRRELNREPASRPWEPRLSIDVQTFSGTRQDWTTLNLEVKRELPVGSVSGQLLQVERFSLVDQALAVDGYLNLWRRAYGNAKVQWAGQPQVLPGLDVTMELFQGFGRGWEASASLRRMVFPGKVVMITGGSLGLYLGDWYGRSRVLFLPDNDGYGVSGAVAIRRYFGTVDNFGEVSVAGGREVEYDANETTIHNNSAFTLRGQSFINRRLGLTFSLGLGRTANFTQRGFNLGLITRW